MRLLFWFDLRFESSSYVLLSNSMSKKLFKIKPCLEYSTYIPILLEYSIYIPIL